MCADPMLTGRSIAASHGLSSLQAPDGDAAIAVLRALPPG